MKKYKVSLTYTFECEIEADSYFDALNEAENQCDREGFLRDNLPCNYDGCRVEEIKNKMED